MTHSTEWRSGGQARCLPAATFVSRVLGFISAAVLAYTLGTIGVAANTFTIANQLPNNIYAIIAGGLLSAILVPQIVRASKDADGGEKFINRVVTLGIVVFLAIASSRPLLAAPLVHLYAAQQATAGQARGLSAAGLPARDGVRILVPAADLLLRAVQPARRGAERAEGLRAVHLGAGRQQPGRDRRAVAFNVSSASVSAARMPPTGHRAWSRCIAGSATSVSSAQAVFLVLLLAARRTALPSGVPLARGGTRQGRQGRVLDLPDDPHHSARRHRAVESRDARRQAQPVQRRASIRLADLHAAARHHHHLDRDPLFHPDERARASWRLRRPASRPRRIPSHHRVAPGLRVRRAHRRRRPVLRGLLAEPRARSSAMAAVLIAYLVGSVPFSIVFVLQRTFYALEDTARRSCSRPSSRCCSWPACSSSATLARPVIALGIAVVDDRRRHRACSRAAVLLRRRMHGLGAAPVVRSYFAIPVALVPAAAAGVGSIPRSAPSRWLRRLRAVPRQSCRVAVIGVAMAVVYVGVLALLRVREFGDLARRRRNRSCRGSYRKREARRTTRHGPRLVE